MFTVYHLSWPYIPWSCIHVEFNGLFAGFTFVVIINAFSKWLEIFLIKSTISERTIAVLFNILLPLVSLNILFLTVDHNLHQSSYRDLLNLMVLSTHSITCLWMETLKDLYKDWRGHGNASEGNNYWEVKRNFSCLIIAPQIFPMSISYWTVFWRKDTEKTYWLVTNCSWD